MPRQYYEYFQNIDSRTFEAIKEAKEDGVWRVEEDEGFDILRDLASKLADIYNIPTPTLSQGTREVYFPAEEHIKLPRVSLVSFLHEFRHHMQHHGMQHYDRIENDARGWSISAFSYALPSNFDSAWEREMIWFMPSYDPNWYEDREEEYQP